MGQLIYGPGTVYEMDDRTLAHVKVAVVTKLRRQETFLLSWSHPVEHGSGRVSLWISVMVPLQFQFSGSRPPVINRAWAMAMMETSHSDRGVVVVSETDVTPRASTPGTSPT